MCKLSLGETAKNVGNLQEISGLQFFCEYPGEVVPLAGVRGSTAQCSAQGKQRCCCCPSLPLPSGPSHIYPYFLCPEFLHRIKPIVCWVRLVSSSSPCRHWPLWEQGCACLCSHGREEGISPGGDPQQSVQMWSAQIWGCGTWRPGWDAPLRTSGVTVRR